MEPKRAKIAVIGNSTNFVLVSDVRDQNETPLRLMLRAPLIYPGAICQKFAWNITWRKSSNQRLLYKLVDKMNKNSPMPNNCPPCDLLGEIKQTLTVRVQTFILYLKQSQFLSIPD